MVTRKDICDAIFRLGVKSGDICLFYSSFKSLGPEEGGAKCVIVGFEDVLGPKGTLVVPALAKGIAAMSMKTGTWMRSAPNRNAGMTAKTLHGSMPESRRKKQQQIMLPDKIPPVEHHRGYTIRKILQTSNHEKPPAV